jgi:hypothetical protein
LKPNGRRTSTIGVIPTKVLHSTKVSDRTYPLA